MTAVDPTSLRAAFDRVRTWIFDLDDTLYSSALGLHESMRRRVVLYLERRLAVTTEAAAALHLDYFGRYGTTLQAVMQVHGDDPAAFLDFVHDIDLSGLRADPDLVRALDALPGRRVVFTNGSRRHAEAVLDAMEMGHLFETVWNIESCGFVGKPQLSAYEGFLAACGIEPGTAAMFEDRACNLVVPHDLGMRTVLVVPADGDPAGPAGPSVDFSTDDLAAFLASVTPAGPEPERTRMRGIQPLIGADVAAI